MVILVTGSNGQLGQSLQFIAKKYTETQFVFCSSTDLNITDKSQILQVFNTVKPDFCINAAAYTAVDKAESEPEEAKLINITGAKYLAEVCMDFDTILIHISTDFVFDGEKASFYNEEDSPNPQSIYGQTKLDGERAIQDTFSNYFIIRTSWVYSQFGNNFMKTMIRLGRERDNLSVVNDQIGTPTNAIDLAQAIIEIVMYVDEIIETGSSAESLYGIYNFSNEGYCSWYDFAKEIFELNDIKINLRPISTSDYPTAAKRPNYSVLDKNKIKDNFNIEIDNWEKSLKTVPKK